MGRNRRAEYTDTSGMHQPFTHLDKAALEQGLVHVRASPKSTGTLDLIVRRPSVDKRETLEAGELDPREGLVGDNWRVLPSRHTHDGSAHPGRQLTLMNSRLAALVAQDPDRWALAGDQLYVDFDLSESNLPPGTRLSIGEAEIEMTDQLHTGCAKFVSRFGLDAMKFVNSPVGRSLRLRGAYARVTRPGAIRRGAIVRKLPMIR
jgi:MOSC domain-containing protein YiiM